MHGSANALSAKSTSRALLSDVSRSVVFVTWPETHCARRTVLGILGHDGAFAEYLSLPLVNLHKLPDKIDDERAVFVEPLAAACEILTQVDVSKFRDAAVLGDGKLAQLIARVLRTKLSRVVMYGKHSESCCLHVPPASKPEKSTATIAIVRNSVTPTPWSSKQLVRRVVSAWRWK